MADASETTQVSHEPADAETVELLAAVRALSAQVGGLKAELQTLRAQTRSLPAGGGDTPGWDAGVPARRSTAAWMRSLESPVVRRPVVPWLFLEIVFLVAVAVVAAVAKLDALGVVAAMGGAWLLVAIAELTAARATRLREEAVYGGLAGARSGFADDPSWFTSPVERTALEVVEGDEDTAARLPPAQG